MEKTPFPTQYFTSQAKRRMSQFLAVVTILISIVLLVGCSTVQYPTFAATDPAQIPVTAGGYEGEYVDLGRVYFTTAGIFRNDSDEEIKRGLAVEAAKRGADKVIGLDISRDFLGQVTALGQAIKLKF